MGQVISLLEYKESIEEAEVDTNYDVFDVTQLNALLEDLFNDDNKDLVLSMRQAFTYSLIENAIQHDLDPEDIGMQNDFIKLSMVFTAILNKHVKGMDTPLYEILTMIPGDDEDEFWYEQNGYRL